MFGCIKGVGLTEHGLTANQDIFLHFTVVSHPYKNDLIIIVEMCVCKLSQLTVIVLVSRRHKKEPRYQHQKPQPGI